MLLALSVLPLSHVFERGAMYMYLYHGAKVYFAEAIERIGDNAVVLTEDGKQVEPGSGEMGMGTRGILQVGTAATPIRPGSSRQNATPSR